MGKGKRRAKRVAAEAHVRLIGALESKMVDPLIVQFWKEFTYNQNESIGNENFAVSKQTVAEGVNISLLMLGESCFVSLSDRYWDLFLNFIGDRSPNEGEINRFAQEVGLDFNPPDNLYYARNANSSEGIVTNDQFKVRQVSSYDLPMFEEMTRECSEEELDAGNVEIDHEIVVGVFVGSKMASRASAYPFMKSLTIYDIGYITHPSFKGLGYGTICCAALVDEIVKRGKLPQIRVQSQIAESIRIAEKVGFVKQGYWTYEKQD